MSTFIQTLFVGLRLGSIYALVALGYTMVYGIIRLINFAHGDFIMVGGYTMIFTVPLALALGLSDEVQMSTGIHLDTLFVDEGFGSLDPESLDQAYRTLTGLTEGNRLVGIISHVAELKEKIDKQIVVTKEKSGGSQATIVV